MKQYIIRRIGWGFNDSEYFLDGDAEIIQIFTDAVEAADFKKHLERESFSHLFALCHRYVFAPDFVKNNTAVAKRVRLHEYLVNEQSFSPTLLIHPRRWVNYEESMFLTPLSNEDIDHMIELVNIDFYKLIEVNNKDEFELIRVKFKSAYLGEDMFICHSGGTEGPMIFNSRIEAVEAFLRSSFSNSQYYKNGLLNINGTIGEIARLPTILEDYITKNDTVYFSDCTLTISKDIDTKTFLQVNELLANPILVYEQIPLKSIVSLPCDNIVNYSVSERQLGRNIESEPEISRIKKTEDYLSWFYMDLDYKYDNNDYPFLIKQYYPEYDGFRKPLKGLIKSYSIIDNRFCVTSTFGYTTYPNPNFHKEGVGEGENLEEAFFNSLDYWLKKFPLE